MKMSSVEFYGFLLGYLSSKTGYRVDFDRGRIFFFVSDNKSLPPILCRPGKFHVRRPTGENRSLQDGFVLIVWS